MIDTGWLLSPAVYCGFGKICLVALLLMDVYSLFKLWFSAAKISHQFEGIAH